MESMLDYVSPTHLWKIIGVAFFGTSLFWVFVLMLCVSGTDASEFQDEKETEDSIEEYTSVEDRLRAVEDKVNKMKDIRRIR